MGCGLSLDSTSILGFEPIIWYRHQDIPEYVFGKLCFNTKTSTSVDSHKLLFHISEIDKSSTIFYVKFAKNGRYNPDVCSTVDDVYVIVGGHGELVLLFDPAFGGTAQREDILVPRESSSEVKVFQKNDDLWKFAAPLEIGGTDQFIIFNREFKEASGNDKREALQIKLTDIEGLTVINQGNVDRATYINELKKGDINWCVANYQYAKTQRPLNELNPLCTVFVENDSDIMQSIDFAIETKRSIAVRSGGHSYSGSSSCDCNNIQLDLGGRIQASKGEPYTYLNYSVSYDKGKDKPEVTCGVAVPLQVLMKNLADDGLFVPTGISYGICVGGHCQTGGLGQLATTFGMFIDYIAAIEIILPTELEQWNGRKGWIHRDTKDPLLADIFYSVCGGSPGDFGVLTQVKISPLRDCDHPNSHGCFATWVYNPDTLKVILNLWDEMIKNDSVPKGSSANLMVLGGSPMWAARQWWYKKTKNWTIDMAMEHFHENLEGRTNLQKSNSADIIGLSALWANLGGENQKYTEKESQFFQKIFDAIHRTGAIRLPDKIGKACGFQLFDSLDINSKPTPISTMVRNWCVKNARESPYPCKNAASVLRRDYATTGKWTSLVEGAISEFLPTYGKDAALNIIIGPLGSRDCAFRNHDGKTSYSWRSYEDGAVMLDCTVFFDPHRTTHDKIEEAYPKCFYSDEWKQRMIWAPAFRYHEERSLDKNWKQFFDSEEKYKRILHTKHKVDPERIFTPNPYRVGYYSKHEQTNTIDDEKKNVD